MVDGNGLRLAPKIRSTVSITIHVILCNWPCSTYGAVTINKTNFPDDITTYNNTHNNNNNTVNHLVDNTEEEQHDTKGASFIWNL